MAEGTDCRFRGAFQNEGGIDTLRSNRKNSISRQVSTDTNYYALRCLESPLELRASALKEDDSRKANQISIRESGTLRTEYSNNTARSKIASSNSGPHTLKSSIETERQRCEIHDGFAIREELEGCPNTETIEKLRASFGELFRIGSLGGDCWKPIVPQKTCRLVHADYHFTSRGSTVGNPTTMSQMQLCEGKSGRTSRCNDSFILVDAFKDNFRISIATLVDYEVLEGDPKKLTYHIRCVADFGFEHIIIIGKTDYGMIFLDCYSRVFLWENMSRTLWPLGDSPEEASKRIVKGELFEDN
ncbi:11_t:CDS:2 [Paraglomus brasilianum]|uniref:11_t:CDS:1 n=1 Tax=Paraglomus brasilianum TaxID=144538 RepID=A0A9N9DPW4_9GLOM|nr:11_t:CDS:2 [Paraglomus brasilianum]